MSSLFSLYVLCIRLYEHKMEDSPIRPEFFLWTSISLRRRSCFCRSFCKKDNAFACFCHMPLVASCFYCRQTIRKEGLVGWLVLSSKYSFRFKKCCWIIQHKCTTGNHHLIGSFCEFITSSMEALDYPTPPGQGRTSDLIGTWISLIGPSHGVISMGTSNIFKVTFFRENFWLSHTQFIVL